MYHVKPHLHIPMFHYLRNKELDELYFSVALKTLAESLIAIFVPIYLFTLGFLLQDIIIYYFIYFLTLLIVYPFGSMLNSRIGIKKVMFVGMLFLIIYYMLLGGVGEGIPYHYAALFYGISSGIYYAAFHIDFAKFADKSRGGSEYSRLKMIAIVAASLGPLIGAIFIFELSFSLLFLLVSIMLILSAFPLFLTKDVKIKMKKITFSGVMKADTKRKAAAYHGCGMIDFSLGILWPLFIYIALKDIVSLGIIITISSVILIFFLHRIGTYSDKKEKIVLKAGIITHSISWLSRLFFLTPAGIFINNFYSSLSYSAIEIPFYKMVYEKARKAKSITNYFIFREVHLWIGRMIILLFAFIVADLYWIFVFTFFATFLFSLLAKK